MEEIMGVVRMSDICETLKKHETTLHFLTLNLTFGVYGYQIDTITYFSELNLFFTHEEEFYDLTPNWLIALAATLPAV